MQISLGFACEWQKDKVATWSHTPYFISEALKQIPGCDLVDLDVSMSFLEKALHAIAGLRPKGAGLVRTHAFSTSFLKRLEKNLLLRIQDQRNLSAILEIGDLGIPGKIPFYIFADLSVDMILKYHKKHGKIMPGFQRFSLGQIHRRRDWQKRVFEQCSGFFTMSRDLATSLSRDCGIAQNKIHVVHSGIHVTPPGNSPPRHSENGARILFVGRDFYRKAGDLVLESFELIRAEHIPHATLIIAGPKKWPLKGQVPEGVEFLGDTSWSVLQESYQNADLFCMPSRNEGFGIVFAEALCFGVPCIGRNHGVMREIIKPGINGYLLDSENKEELACLILKVLNDKSLRDRVRRDSDQAREYYSWSRVASQIVETIQADLS